MECFKQSSSSVIVVSNFSVTVITPTIPERSNLLADAIDSVAAQQIQANGHLIGVDSSRQGPSYIRNKLSKSVDTEWIAFLDDDDILYNNHISVASQAKDHSDIIYTWCTSVGRDNFNPNSYFDAERLMNAGNYIPVTTFVRTAAFFAVGGFDLEARFEDWDLWKRLYTNGYRFTCIPVITWSYRFLGNNRTFMDL